MAQLINIKLPRGEGALVIRSDQVACIEHAHRHAQFKSVITRVCDGRRIEVDEWPSDIEDKINAAEGR